MHSPFRFTTYWQWRDIHGQVSKSNSINFLIKYFAWSGNSRSRRALPVLHHTLRQFGLTARPSIGHVAISVWSGQQFWDGSSVKPCYEIARIHGALLIVWRTEVPSLGLPETLYTRITHIGLDWEMWQLGLGDWPLLHRFFQGGGALPTSISSRLFSKNEHLNHTQVT